MEKYINQNIFAVTRLEASNVLNSQGYIFIRFFVTVNASTTTML